MLVLFATMSDHNYNLEMLHEACDDIDIDEELGAVGLSAKEAKINKDHTPIKEPNPKKQKYRSGIEDENTGAAILQAVQALT